MAEPWSHDFGALAERSQQGLRSLEATRASLSTRKHDTQERTMRFFKTHPALAALVTILALSLVGGAAYAVVREVWVSIDPDKSAPEIQQDVNSQLEQQGVHANVEISKPGDGRIGIKIKTTGEQAGSDMENLHIQIAGKEANVEDVQRRMKLHVQCQLDEAQLKALQETVSSEPVIEAIENHESNDDIAKAMTKALADAGFHDVDVQVDDTGTLVTVKSPPTK